MRRQADPLYDVFISYSPEDQAWVHDWLLSRLEATNLRVAIDFRDFVIGMPRIENIERAIENSRRTVVVLTPEWLDSEWNAFEALLLRAADPAARRRKLLPLLLKPCDLPKTITALKLEPADFRQSRNWERQFKRLRRDIEDTIPVPFPLTKEGAGGLWQWKRWLRRYRREIRRAVLIAFVVWLTASLILQLPPFDSQMGWQALGFDVKGAWRLTRAENVLLVSTSTNFLGCNPADTGDTGLWRSTDQGVTWEMIAAPLEFERPSQGCVLAAIVAFAHATAYPRRIYAATTDVGLLRSDDAGENWTRIGSDILPVSLKQVVVTSTDPDRVFVAANPTGLYRSLNGGDSWRQLDGADTCTVDSQEESALPVSFSAGAMATRADAVYVGTDSGLEAPGPQGGLYVSRDDGNCWRRVDGTGQRYSYVALVVVPDATDQLLVLAFDHYQTEGKPPLYLWLIQADQGRIKVLSEFVHSVGALFAEQGTPPRWYVVTDIGEVFTGVTGTTDATESLPGIPSCAIPPTCFTDLTPDFQPGPPLLLANNHVYRLGVVPWYRRLWP